MSIIDDILDALKKAAEITDPDIGGGIIPQLDALPEKKARIVGLLSELHIALGVAEHFSTGALKTAEEVADEIIEVLQTQPTDQPTKQEGAD